MTVTALLWVWGRIVVAQVLPQLGFGQFEKAWASHNPSEQATLEDLGFGCTAGLLLARPRGCLSPQTTSLPVSVSHSLLPKSRSPNKRLRHFFSVCSPGPSFCITLKKLALCIFYALLKNTLRVSLFQTSLNSLKQWEPVPPPTKCLDSKTEFPTEGGTSHTFALASDSLYIGVGEVGCVLLKMCSVAKWVMHL